MAILQLHAADGKLLTINARRESTVIMQASNTSYTFDYAGRMIGAFRDGRNYRRSFANEILEKQSGPRPGLSGRLRRMLAPDEVRALETDAYDFAGAAAAQLRQLEAPADPEAVQVVREALARVNQYCYTGLEREREIYQHIYHPVTILPPDQYLSVYLQMTEGCSFNECSFCGFYRDRRYHVKPPEVFHEHIRRVRAFIGEGLSLRRSIFLGDANALALPLKMLLPRFDIIQQEFDIVPRGLVREPLKVWQAAHPIHFDGIYSFIDAFTTATRRAADYAALAERGLRRVYIGLESGDPGLLKFLQKPNMPEDMVRVVRECKAGGLDVGIILLVGAGGKKFEQAHIEHTTQLVNTMPLDEHDIIYLSELVDFPGSTYAQLAAKAGVEPLTYQEIENQMRVLRAGLLAHSAPEPEAAPAAPVTAPRPRTPRVSWYDVREFVY